MGNHLWRVCPKTVTEIKLVDSYGSLRFLQERRISADEIMKRYPQNLVSPADSFYIGQKVPVLSAEAKLEAGQSYFILPEKMRGSVLSAAWLASLAAGASKSSPLYARFSSAPNPFQIEKSKDGRLRLRILPEFIQKILEDAGKNEDDFSGLCNTAQLQKDFKQLVKGRAQGWRPKLETILEKEKGCKPFTLKRKRRI